MAEGSIEECRYYLILAKDLNYGDPGRLNILLEEVSRLLNAYSAAILSNNSYLTARFLRATSALPGGGYGVLRLFS